MAFVSASDQQALSHKAYAKISQEVRETFKNNIMNLRKPVYGRKYLIWHCNNYTLGMGKIA